MTTHPFGDDAVLARVTRRTRLAAGLPIAVAVVVAAAAWGWPGSATGASGVAIVAVAVAILLTPAVVLLRRVRLWTVAAKRATEWTGSTAQGHGNWAKAVCGPPVPLFKPAGSGSLLRRARKLPPVVVPVRAESGPLQRGEAVIVHARADGLIPESGDVLAVAAVSRRGPFLLGRAADGALFVADRFTGAAS